MISRDVTIICLFAAVIFLFLSNFGILGPVGDFFSQIMFGFCGKPGYVLPILILGLSLYYASCGDREDAGRKMAAVIVLFAVASAFFGLLRGAEAYTGTYSMSHLYQFSAEKKSGGGILGGSICFLSLKLFRTVGSYFLLVLVTILACIVLTEKSLADVANALIGRGGRSFSLDFLKAGTRRPRPRYEEEEEDEEYGDYEEEEEEMPRGRSSSERDYAPKVTSFDSFREKQREQKLRQEERRIAEQRRQLLEEKRRFEAEKRRARIGGGQADTYEDGLQHHRGIMDPDLTEDVNYYEEYDPNGVELEPSIYGDEPGAVYSGRGFAPEDPYAQTALDPEAFEQMEEGTYYENMRREPAFEEGTYTEVPEPEAVQEEEEAVPDTDAPAPIPNRKESGNLHEINADDYRSVDTPPEGLTGRDPGAGANLRELRSEEDEPQKEDVVPVLTEDMVAEALSGGDGVSFGADETYRAFRERAYARAKERAMEEAGSIVGDVDRTVPAEPVSEGEDFLADAESVHLPGDDELEAKLSQERTSLGGRTLLTFDEEEAASQVVKPGTQAASIRNEDDDAPVPMASAVSAGATEETTPPWEDDEDDAAALSALRAVQAAPRADSAVRAQAAAPVSASASAIAVHTKDTEDDTVSEITRKSVQADEEEHAKEFVAPKEEAEVKKPRFTPRKYIVPPLSLLKPGKEPDASDSEQELRDTAERLQSTLATFGVRVHITDISQGPAVTRYEMQPEQGVKVSKIVGLQDDIKLALAATDIRIEAPIPGKSAVGIEVPNRHTSIVALRDILDTPEFMEFKSKTAFGVGKDIAGKTVVTDIAKMPHVLIAGSTGSGKSVCINTIIMSIIYHADPREVKMIMIDPKVVELSVYNGIPHLMLPVVTQPQKAAATLNWAVAEMEARFRRFADCRVRDIKGYNALVGQKEAEGADMSEYPFMPHLVVIVDELADLMMVAKNDVETAICRLAQLARAAGIHLIIATQRPSVDVITGLIKANMPSRIAFAVTSGTDSRTILDMNGAEKLLGKGDMLFFPQGLPKPQRVQGAFVSDDEVTAVVNFLKENDPPTESGEELLKKIESIANGSDPAAASSAEAGGDKGSEIDDLFVKSGQFIIEKNNASIGLLQRLHRIGFNRAARIMDQLCEAGVVSESEGTKPRKVLMNALEFEEFCRQAGLS